MIRPSLGRKGKTKDECMKAYVAPFLEDDPEMFSRDDHDELCKTMTADNWDKKPDA